MDKSFDNALWSAFLRGAAFMADCDSEDFTKPEMMMIHREFEKWRAESLPTD